MGEDYSNVDYDLGYDEPEYDVTMYCVNPKCRHVYGTYEISEWDTNAHTLPDNAYTCPECGADGQEDEPSFEEEVKV